MKRIQENYVHRFATPALLLVLSAGLLGCPPLGGGGGFGYDAGYAVGFAEDAEYWQGYDDSWDTRDGGDIYYTGHEIPYIDDNSYDAGYWDGVWYAYNDGYFVAYDYAFVIGFTEGYDAAFASDWRSFIAGDTHVEWLDGGFSDGYNDGFSEGRMLGAVDWDEGLPFDWQDALLFYQSGEDVYIPELDLGTGEYGPVFLYFHGDNPFDFVKSTQSRNIRKQGDSHQISYRSFPAEVSAALDQDNTTSLRGNRTLTRIDASWLDRVNSYNALYEKSAAPRPRAHAVK